MRLDFSDARYRTKDTPFCDFPAGWDGEVESLDEPAPINLSSEQSEGVGRP